MCDDLVFELRSNGDAAALAFVCGVKVSLVRVGRFRPPPFTADRPLQVLLISFTAGGAAGAGDLLFLVSLIEPKADGGFLTDL